MVAFKVPRVIANIESTDRAAYITLTLFQVTRTFTRASTEKRFVLLLGGVDELGITAGATAYEIKSLYGRAATSATRRCRGLLTYGLCKLLSLIIFNEEKIFRESFAGAIGLQCALPMREDFGSAVLFLAGC